MTRRLPFLAVPALAILLAVAALPAAGQGSDDWSSRRIAGDLDVPVDLAFGPDGTLYYAELRTGNVRAIPPGASAPLDEPVVSVDASGGGNGGFLGLALDPDFEETGAFFVYYSYEKADAENGKVNRVSRVDASGERVLLDDIPWAEMHDGGRLVFTGPDTLVVATGDNEKRTPAQERDSLLGKTLRMTRDGSPAPDNPDPSSLLYTLGHRNIFGIAYDAASGTLWATENGPDRGDEVNILVAGGNYGWPKHLGVAEASGYVDPVVEFDAPIGPTGAAVLQGELYFGDFNNGDVHRVTRAADGSYQAAVVWGEVGQVLDVEASADGKLYVSSYGEIHVLTPPDGLVTAQPTPATPTPPPATSPIVPPTATPVVTPAASPVVPPTTSPVVTPAASPDSPATPGAPEESTEPPSPTPAADVPAAGFALGALAAVAAALARRRTR